MKFKVIFSTGLNNNTSPFDHFNPGRGLDYVQAIRELALMPEAPLDLIEANTTCSMLTGKSEIAVLVKSEDDVDKINGFDVKKESDVIVPAGYLGQFVFMTVEITRETPSQAGDKARNKWVDDNPSPDEDDFMSSLQMLVWKWKRNRVDTRAKEMCRSLPEDRRLIRKISNGWDVDKKALYAAWKDAGFPIYWGISEKVFAKHKEERKKILVQIRAEEAKNKEQKLKDEAEKRNHSFKHIAEDLIKLGNRLNSLTSR